MSPRRIAVATCRVLPEPDPDQDLLLEGLRAAGLEPELHAWDGADAGLAGFDACLLRSTWNYPEHPADFEAWLEGAGRSTRVFNPVELVRWNLHKRYLLELGSCGVPVVPTALVSRGSRRGLASLLEARGWDDVVIKPAVSAGSMRTRRFRPHQREEGEAFLAELSADADTLVQRYESSVEEGGERALVWIDGEFTHAVAKAPRFDTDDESVSEALPLEGPDRALAERLIAPLAGRLLYARVDVMDDERGLPRLSELELIEPSLFLLQNPAALDRLVSGLRRRLA